MSTSAALLSSVSEFSSVDDHPVKKPTSFRFTGEGSEYFRIWIVNIALTILTLGIYSAWAKVRRNRYIYGNTYLNNVNFEYHVRPEKILFGRMLAVILFAIWFGSDWIVPEIAEKIEISNFGPSTWGIVEWTFLIFGLLYIVAAIVSPYLIAMSMKFRLRNSSHRNLRFRFAGDYKGAFIAWIVWGAVAGATLFVLYPVYVRRRIEYSVENSMFGDEKFRFTGDSAPLFAIYVMTSILFACAFLSYFALVSIYTNIDSEHDQDSIALSANPVDLLQSLPDWSTVFGLVVAATALLICLSIAFGYLHSRVFNYRWDNTEIKNSRFTASMKARPLAWIYFSNLVAIVFSFGLLAAWAKMRSVSYRVHNLDLKLRDDLDDFVGRVRADDSAVAEEAADIMDLDFGL